MHVIQLLPRLDDGPVSREVRAINRALQAGGFFSSVVSQAGSQVMEVTAEGGRFFQQDQVDKNPLTMVARAEALRQLLRTLAPDVIHVHGRVSAWIAVFANLKLGIPIVSTLHRHYAANAFSEVIYRVDRVLGGASGEEAVAQAVAAYRSLVESPKGRVHANGKPFEPVVISRADA